MVFKNLCILVLWTKVAIALEGIRRSLRYRIVKEISILHYIMKILKEPILTDIIIFLVFQALPIDANGDISSKS